MYLTSKSEVQGQGLISPTSRQMQLPWQHGPSPYRCQPPCRQQLPSSPYLQTPGLWIAAFHSRKPYFLYPDTKYTEGRDQATRLILFTVGAG